MSPDTFVSINDRLQPADQSAGPGRDFFTIPANKILVITDIVIQNRAPGDNPVADTDFSRLTLSGDPTFGPGSDFTLTVVGNRTLNLHFSTGIRTQTRFRVLNAPNSSAPFVEYIVNGYLADKPAGF